MPCIRTCWFTDDYNGMKKARKWWEDWDLRILTLYILIAQLYLHFFGRLRRKNKSVLMMIVSVWLLYLFSDLLATIALGKLSKIKVEGEDKVDPNNMGDDKGDHKNMGEHVLRVMWAPLILFYLGGPDTITVLRVEENKLWVRHLIGLLTQGLRTAYALIVTWNKHGVSLLALLVFVPGIIKYGERVWVVKTRSKDYKDFVQIDLPTIDKISASQPNAEPVLLAYSWFRTLMPHDKDYECDANDVTNLVTTFRKSVTTVSFNAFKLIEIELGLIYDILFSKVGTIFTAWGSLLRFLSFSLIISVLVIYITCDKPRGHLEGDHIVTIILLAGAIFLEIAGIVVQLVSDWALVWACKNGSKWTTSVLFLHKILISKRPRWSGVIGQFSLREFCDSYKPTWCNKMSNLFGRVKMLKRFSSKKSLDQHLKDLIITHLRVKLGEAVAVNTSQISTKRVANINTSETSTQQIEEDKLQPSIGKVANVDDKFSAVVKRGEWTLERFDLVEQFKWSIKLEFGQSIVIWHVATQVCYESDYPKFFGEEVKLKTVKILSDYMMYLLVACPDRFPFCKQYVKIMQDYAEMKKVFRGVVLSRLEGVENEGEGDTTNIPLVNKAQKLAQDMQGNPMRWDIMHSMWAEMLCYAATECPVDSHIQELRHGGEFLTHVWLLVLHFGIGIKKKLEGSPSSLKDECEGCVKAFCGCFGEIEGDQKDRLDKKVENAEKAETCCGLLQ